MIHVIDKTFNVNSVSGNIQRLTEAVNVLDASVVRHLDVDINQKDTTL